MQIDVWMQHPTSRLAQQDMFESLRRWTGEPKETTVSLETTIASMDEASVERALICAWYGPTGPLISNDEVAGFVSLYPDRFVGVASGRPTRWPASSGPGRKQKVSAQRQATPAFPRCAAL